MPIQLPALGIQAPQQPDVLGQVAKLRQIQGMGQEQQIRSQQIQAATQANQLQAQKVKDVQTVTDLYKKNHGDIDKTVQDAANAGVTPETLQGLQQHALLMKTQNVDLLQKQGTLAIQQADLMKGAHDTVAKASQQDRPAVYQQQLMGLRRSGVDVSQMPLQYPGDAQFELLGAAVQGHTKQLEDLAKQAEISKNTAQAGEATAGTGEKQAETELKKAQLGAVQQGGAVPGVSLDVQEANSWLKKNPGKTLADFQKYKATLVPAFNFNLQNATGAGGGGAGSGGAADIAKRFGYTPTAFDQAAEKYWSSGQLPPAGRGGPALAANKAIQNRAAELHPDGSLAANSAEYKANSDSLKKIQTNFDQVTAFENTAGKNLDVFLKTAQRVVDSGSPWISKPLRMVSSGGLGSEDQAAFNAARQTAVTEIAKVLNSSNASGVLSDSARHEVEGLIGPNASLKQIVSAANVLKQDMANRHQAYSDQIGDIKGRMGGKQQPPSAASAGGTAVPKSNDFFSQFGGKSK